MLNLCIEVAVGGLMLLALPHIETKDLKIVFWIDPLQNSIYEDITHVLNNIKDLQLETTISDAVLEIQSSESVDLYQESPTDFLYNDKNTLQFCEILSSQGVSIVIDFSYQSWQQGLLYIHEYNIPYIRVDRILRPFVDVFAKYLSEKNAQDAGIIVTNKADETAVLLDVLDGLPFRAVLFTYNEEENSKFSQRLQSMKPSPAYYGVFADAISMNAVFAELEKSGIFERPAEWHFVFLDSKHQIFKYRKTAENATEFILNADDLCKKVSLKESHCERDFDFQRAMLFEILRGLIDIVHSERTALEPVRQTCKAFSSLNHENSNSVQLRNDFKILDHLVLSDFLMASDRYQVFKPMKSYAILTYALNCTIKIIGEDDVSNSAMAVWQSGRLFKINETISPARRFFRIGTAEAIPWSYNVRDPLTGLVKLDANGKPIWKGFCIDLIEALSQKMDFQYELVGPSRGTFGERDEKTGKWNGLVGDLLSGEIEFAVAALKMYSEREEVIDFIAPYFESTGISIVMRKPVQKRSLFKFMSVLKLEVWLSILASVIATAILMWIVEKYSPYSTRNNNSKTAAQACRVFTLKECFWFTLTSFTPQGGGEAPKSMSGRILVAGYWMFVVLMLATFTANLAAFLTVERMRTPVQSLEHLGKQSRINYTVVHESDTHQYFINMKFAEDMLYRMWKEQVLNASPNSHKYRIWDYPIKEQYGRILLAINNSNPVKDAAEGFRKVNDNEKGDFAFIHDSSEIKYELTRNCNLTEVGEVFAKQSYAIATQQGSQLQDELCYALLELQQDRFLDDLKSKYWNQSQCPSADDERGITLESVGGVFVAASAGLIIAAIVLIFEVYYYKKKDGFIGKEITQVQPVANKLETKNALNVKNYYRSPPPYYTVSYISAHASIGKISKIRPLNNKQYKRRQIEQNLHHTVKNMNALQPYIE